MVGNNPILELFNLETLILCKNEVFGHFLEFACLLACFETNHVRVCVCVFKVMKIGVLYEISKK